MNNNKRLIISNRYIIFIKHFSVILFLVVLSSNFSKAQLPDANWHAAIKLNDTLELPFTFSSTTNKIIIHNNDESIIVDEIKFAGDSVFIQMPVFDSEFRCRIKDGKLTGRFYNHARKSDNVFDFHGEQGLSYRFSDKPERTIHNISGRYLTIFDGEDELSRKAVGIFKQDGNRLTGTFLTVTGDYRYLDGEVNGNRIWLSAFDGSHLFLFTALIKGDSLINGEYFSGKHWHDTWRGKIDPNAALPDPEKLVSFKNNGGKFSFRFPDENGKIISDNDVAFKDKPMIIQLMGSWCPNCMDETKYLSKWYNETKPNLKIVALDFERITDTATVHRNIHRLKKQFNINYPVLFAGSNDKQEAAKTLNLSNVIAFPTLIFLNKEKQIVRIHSGFTGPATGDDYLQFQKWFEKAAEEVSGF